MNLRGLSSDEAARRLEAQGPNDLAEHGPRALWATALDVVREPMLLMLVVAGSIYLILGEISDSLMLMVAVVAVITITVVQERRTQRALERLRELASPHATVLRDGQRVRTASSALVCGDLVLVSEGDRVPADGILRDGVHLSADESLLTGESVPVLKVTSHDGMELHAPGGEGLASMFAGTIVTTGEGIFEVVATGPRTQLGLIGAALDGLTLESTRLQNESKRLIRLFATVGLGSCLIVVIAYALTRGAGFEAWKHGLLAGIALAMAALPEEIPVVMTVFFAIGAWRMSRVHVLTRRLAAIETLGSATVLCVDKTGTLTQNKMSLQRLVTTTETDISIDTAILSATDELLLQCAVLASRRNPFDPMERALVDAAARFPGKSAAVADGWSLLREYPIDPSLLAVSQAWSTRNDDQVVVATKGAPEAVFRLCCLDQATRESLEQAVARLAVQGLRVLAVARSELTVAQLPKSHSELRPSFVGLVALEDPIRESVPRAVRQCQAAGVRLAMITGDYPATAQSIARQAGFQHVDRILTGREIAALSDVDLAAQVGQIDVFARVVPAQKLRIVRALQSLGNIVAMTGDGVNDVPALKQADIGIAMGGRGSDAAREAASLVLLNDDFTSIVEAIAQGRRIYDNIKKAIAFILAVHVPIIGLSLIPVFVPSWPLLLLPVHIAVLELVIDPTCALVFEAEEPEVDVMQRPPRAKNEALFTWTSFGRAGLQGLVVLLACVLVFISARLGHGEYASRAATFTALVVAIVCLTAVMRSQSRGALAMFGIRNPAQLGVSSLALGLLALALFVPAVRDRFHFSAVSPADLALSVLAGVASVVWVDLLKRRARVRAASAAH